MEFYTLGKISVYRDVESLILSCKKYLTKNVVYLKFYSKISILSLVLLLKIMQRITIKIIIINNIIIMKIIRIDLFLHVYNIF